KFKKIEVAKVVSRSSSYKTLSSEQSCLLDSSITLDEIKLAIWDCGSDKSPGPDGFTFAGTHLIKDCDFYEKQMANKTVGIKVGPVHGRNKVNYKNQFVPQVVLLKTGKVNIPLARPHLTLLQPNGSRRVPTGSFVPTGCSLPTGYIDFPSG
nr:transposon TX1 uncharacterized [Tanacetum cinerariifolium]